LFRRTAILAACVGIGMHAALLIVLGPLGRNYGASVWPWNMGLLALLAIAAFKLRLSDTSWKPLIPLEIALTSTLIIVPISNLFGDYMHFASYRLYTMNDTRGALYLEEGVNPEVDRWRDGVVVEAGRKVSKIDLFNLALRNGSLTMYANASVYRRSFEHLCPTDSGRMARLVIKPRWSWAGQPTPETFVCNEPAKLPSASR
jgi:hypothetical protein